MPGLSLPLTRRRRRSLAAGVLCVGLTACQGKLVSSAALQNAQASGEILFPPAAGEVVLEGTTGGSTFGVVEFPVGQDGLYTVALPPPTQLPAGGNTSVLPLLPDIGLLGVGSVICPGRPKVSDPAARLVLVGHGTFMQAGRVTGELRPAAQAIGGQNVQDSPDFSLVVRQYAYADRDVQLSGTLNCTYKTLSGAALAGTVQADYQLRRGWNVLVSQTGRSGPAGPLNTTLTAQSTLSAVQWRYWPVSP